MRRTAMLVGIAVSCVLLGAGPPAQAAGPVLHEDVTVQESFLDCGYENSSTFSASNLLLDANPSTSGQFFRFSFTWQGSTLVTNPLTGAHVTISGHGVYKEIQPRELGGGLFTYVEHNVGTFEMRDASGVVLLREAGRIAFTFLFDSLSDSGPGGDQISVTLLRVSGPHPEFLGDIDFCSLLDAAIG